MLNSTSKKLYFLISIFIIGFISLFLLNQFFVSLVTDLDKQTKNYEAKLQIGEFIDKDILKVKSLFFELATTTTSARARAIVRAKIDEVINNIEDSLDVIENGGVLTREIELNIAGHPNIKQKIVYHTDISNEIPLTVIDLRPKLIELKEMVEKVDNLLKIRHNTQKRKDSNAFSKVAKKIRRFYKTTPAFFQRMSENIRRLIYESDIELKSIKANIIHKKEKYQRLKLVLIISVIFIVVIIGYWISRIINKENLELLNLSREFKKKEIAIQAILDGQESIVIVSNGIEMIDANEALLKFFYKYKTKEEFFEEHQCICDFFMPYNNDSSYLLKKDYNGDTWLDYLLKHKKTNFKVLMNNGKEDNHFSISANKKYIDDENFILIVSLTNITSEVISKIKLAELNNNLEKIINAKTEELQQLNNSLEKKVQEELNKNRKKDQQMIEQSRFAALGEMIGNIAHQWRQPLSAISSTASSVQVQMQLGIASNEDINKSYEDIKGYVEFLTQTIEDFRSFMKQDENVVEFNINDVAQKSIGITSAGYKDNGITLVQNFIDKELLSKGSPSKLSQVFLNILNNARDAILDNKIEKKYVHISSSEDENNNIIQIQDNAGGIPDKIITKIFDPYFTTKHQSQGTGIGLYMSKDIVEKHMKGTITVENKTVVLDDMEFTGACFTVSIPKIS